MNEMMITKDMDVVDGMSSRKSTYSYAAILEASEKVNWTVEDLIGEDKKLDFSCPFLPDALARTEALDFLTREERLILNQLRGHNYLYLFGLVEEFILPFVMDHARADLCIDDDRTRALLGFAGEEAKHIQLFKRFREAFQRDFGHEVAVIGPPEAIAKAVLAHDPLSVAMVILHIEWMTQRHYLDSIKDDGMLDAQFKSLLRHHWMEEAQHAKLDTLMVEMLAEGRTPEQIEQAVDGYLEIGTMLDGGLAQQIDFDMEAFESITGVTLSEGERVKMREQQHQAMRWTFLGSGMSHPKFLQSLGRMSPAQRDRLAEVALAFS